MAPSAIGPSASSNRATAAVPGPASGPIVPPSSPQPTATRAVQTSTEEKTAPRVRTSSTFDLDHERKGDKRAQRPDWAGRFHDRPSVANPRVDLSKPPDRLVV